jgi:sterol desaturase/sphingolipid hydroxylase (fatty acid hydroxylase superfamily)
MKTDDLVALLILGTFLLFLISEKFIQARTFPEVRGWNLLGLGFFIVIMGVGAVFPLLLPMDWIAKHSLLPGQRLGVLGGVLVGYPAVSLATALVHRAMHRSNVLWRWIHQMHHAPNRVDIPGAVLFHPFDMLQNNAVSVLVTVLVLGLHPEAAAWTGFVAIFYGLFQHWNVKTPAFLGYLIQRPESHCIHHQKDLHAYNYSDFPLWDILMGTFRNPKEWQGEAGFDEAVSRKYGAMLIGRDVNPQMTNGGAKSAA